MSKQLQAHEERLVETTRSNAHKREDSQAAWEHVQKALAANPNDAGMLIEKARLLHTVKADLFGSIKVLRQAVESDPQNAEAWNSLGVCVTRENDRILVTQYKRLKQELAILEEGLERRQTYAVECFIKATKANPADPAAWSNLIENYEKGIGAPKDLVKAFECARHVLQAAGDEAPESRKLMEVRISRLAALMTPEERAKAIQEWPDARPILEPPAPR